MLGAESPLCHLGTTQVGLCGEGLAWLERERRIWGQTQDLGNGPGLGGRCPGHPRLEGRRHPHLACSSLHLCPQVLLQEPGWQQLEQHWAQRRAQALLILHRGLRACISRQRLRLLPRMQARVRGLQARSAGVG